MMLKKSIMFCGLVGVAVVLEVNGMQPKNNKQTSNDALINALALQQKECEVKLNAQQILFNVTQKKHKDELAGLQAQVRTLKIEHNNELWQQAWGFTAFAGILSLASGAFVDNFFGHRVLYTSLMRCKNYLFPSNPVKHMVTVQKTLSKPVPPTHI